MRQKESKEMKKTHKLMIPLLVAISISAILGASVISARVIRARAIGRIRWPRMISSS